MVLAQQVLLDVPGERGRAAAGVLAAATRRLIRGQVDDVRFEGQPDISLAQCAQMAADKTGALMGASTALGAVLAGAPARTVRALQEFGEELGMAFQLVDDVLGIWGDPEATGKPVLSDLRSRKNSLPVSYALSRHDHYSLELTAWLADRDCADEARLWVIAALVEAAGGRDWAEKEARRRLDRSERLLRDAKVAPSVVDELVALGRFIVSRES
jgi:geranylgeranyl diphosphate synthase type I